MDIKALWFFVLFLMHRVELKGVKKTLLAYPSRRTEQRYKGRVRYDKLRSKGFYSLPKAPEQVKAYVSKFRGYYT
jgi:hypothetical protein